MIQKFLKAKHWQIFLLTFGIAMLFQPIMMGTMVANIEDGNSLAPSFIFNFFSLFSIMMVIVMGGLFGWFWSMAIGLQSKIPENVKMKVNTFKILFFIPLIYMALILLFLTISMNISPPTGAIFAVILPIHLFSMFCIFHSIYFIAKTLKIVELQRDAKFSEFVGEFFMLWFYPFGIWIIQPQINKIFRE